MRYKKNLRHILGSVSRRSLIIVGMIIVGLVLVGSLILLLGPITIWAGGTTVQAISVPQAKAAAINAVRQTLLTATAGTFALIALAFTVRTYYLSRSGQVANRFTDAAAMLASAEPDERIAGIYALESIMVQSEHDHNTVIEVLAAFIRHHATTGTKPAPILRKPGELISQAENIAQRSVLADIETALYVLGKRPRRPERQTIDLSNSDLRSMNLSGLNFARANFLGAWMHDASMVGTDLRGAWLFAVEPSWDAVGERSFTPVQAQGITAIQIGNCLIDDRTHLPPLIRVQTAELKAWWDADGPADSKPSWLEYQE